MSTDDPHYPDSFVEALQAIWGDGFLSPGGPEEVAAMLSDSDLSGARVLDIGCGVGGVDVLLVEAYDAEHVTAIDVEASLIEHAVARVNRMDLGDRIEPMLVSPGPLPFDPDGFDVVFSKDAMLHIPDKRALYADVLRVLRPGGRLIASDWLRGGDEEGPVPDILRVWGEVNGLVADFATPDATRRAMESAGFEDARVVDRNAWYREEIKKEGSQVTGPGFQQLSAALGEDRALNRVESYKVRRAAVDAGALRPCHLYGRKPL
jgi:SAM-dependent methyltransferase